MTLTTHGHHIPGTDYNDESGEVRSIARCGGPGVCRRCTREAQQLLHPETIVVTDDVDVTNVNIVELDPKTLRLIAAKMRTQNPAPTGRMRADRQILAESLYAFIKALESVADDMENSVYREAVQDA